MKKIKNKKQKRKSFIEMFQLLKEINFLGIYIYIITVYLYPNVVINLKLIEMDEAYMINTILIIINACDNIGRYLVVKFISTKKLIYIVILTKTLLLLTYLLNYDFQNGFNNLIFISFFFLFNIITLEISNEVGTSLCFGIDPTLVDNEYKGQAGALISFFLTLGTFTGTILAFLTGYIMSLM